MCAHKSMAGAKWELFIQYLMVEMMMPRLRAIEHQSPIQSHSSNQLCIRVLGQRVLVTTAHILIDVYKL